MLWLMLIQWNGCLLVNRVKWRVDEPIRASLCFHDERNVVVRIVVPFMANIRAVLWHRKWLQLHPPVVGAQRKLQAQSARHPRHQLNKLTLQPGCQNHPQLWRHLTKTVRERCQMRTSTLWNTLILLLLTKMLLWRVPSPWTDAPIPINPSVTTRKGGTQEAPVLPPAVLI